MKRMTAHKALLHMAVLQQLRTYGIKLKHWHCKHQPGPEGGKDGATPTVVGESNKTFGIPLYALPKSFVQEYGNIPIFLVEACKYLEEHADTEGLFRKSGSIVRLKALKSKLDHGENCLSTAAPCDVAGLLKQFFRELPEPVLKPDLHEAFFKAQQLACEEERSTATLLLSCLLPDRNIETLRFFFSFLHNVARRSDENKMNSSNLAVILAPNLLQSTDGHERMSASTEKKLRLQTAMVCTLIDHASEIGFIPEFIWERTPALLGVDIHCGTPSLGGYEEGECGTPGEPKRCRRRSMGDIVTGALNKLKSNRTPSTTPQADRNAFSSMVTPMILTPSMKRKLPSDSSQGFSSKKLRSLKHNLTLDILPNSLCGSGSTPASGQNELSPCVFFETSQYSPSPCISSVKHLSNSGNQRRSKRLESKKVHRMESGKMSCFSPKISRKEMVRRSLRLKFSLGRNSKDTVLNKHPSTSGSENIGWRLANQWESEQRAEPKKGEATCSPNQDAMFTKRGTENISRSEENLLTPKSTKARSHQISWTAPGPVQLQDFSDQEGMLKMGYLNATNPFSEPSLVAGKPPAVPMDLKSSIVANYKQGQEEIVHGNENVSDTMLLKIQKAFSESGSNLHTLINEAKYSAVASTEERLVEMICKQESELKKDLNVTSVSIAEENDSSKMCLQQSCSTKDANRKNTTSLLKGDDFQGNSESQYHVEELKEEKRSEELEKCHLLYKKEQQSLFIHPSKAKIIKPVFNRQIKVVKLESSTDYVDSSESSTLNPLSLEQSVVTATAQPTCALPNLSMVENAPVRVCSLVPISVKCKPKMIQATNHIKVSDHIQWFNKLSLNDLNSGTRPTYSLKLPHTPVRQSVRRINSLCEIKRQVTGGTVVKPDGAHIYLKSVSCDGTCLSSIEPVFLDSKPLLPCLKAPTEQETTSHEHLTTDGIDKKSCYQFIDPFEHSDSLGNASIDKSKMTALIQSKSILEDVTNYDVIKAVGKNLVSHKNSLNRIPVANVENGVIRRISVKEKSRFKGSPKNPIAKAKFQPASKPLEL